MPLPYTQSAIPNIGFLLTNLTVLLYTAWLLVKPRDPTYVAIEGSQSGGRYVA